MSSIIEGSARTLKDWIPGLSVDTESNQRQNARGGELIKQLATGGLALGGGVSAAVVLMNYLKSMQQESEIEDETRLNDDTLYIPTKPKEQQKEAADVNRWLAPGLAVTGGVLSAGAAYAATQAIYNYLQKKHREKLLDEAQNETLVAADMEAEKSAAEMTFSDLVTAFPVAVPLLAAIASGGVAYAALNKTFPVVSPPKSKYPRRIRQVAENGDTTALEVPGVKSASAADIWAERDCEAAANEFLILMTDRIAMEKGATCITSDILNHTAVNGDSTQMLRDYGLLAMSESVKGASVQSPGMKALAAAVICKSARLAPSVSAIAAAELLDMLPNITSACDVTNHEQMDKLAGVAALLQMNWTRPDIEKTAAALDQDHPLLAALKRLLMGAPEQPSPVGAPLGHEADDRDAAMTSDVSGSMGEDAEGGDETSDEEEESQSDDDVIDSFMGDPKSAPPPTN